MLAVEVTSLGDLVCFESTDYTPGKNKIYAMDIAFKALLPSPIGPQIRERYYADYADIIAKFNFFIDDYIPFVSTHFCDVRDLGVRADQLRQAVLAYAAGLSTKPIVIPEVTPAPPGKEPSPTDKVAPAATSTVKPPAGLGTGAKIGIAAAFVGVIGGAAFFALRR